MTYGDKRLNHAALRRAVSRDPQVFYSTLEKDWFRECARYVNGPQRKFADGVVVAG